MVQLLLFTWFGARSTFCLMGQSGRLAPSWRRKLINVAVERSDCRDPKTLAGVSTHPFGYAVTVPSFVMQIGWVGMQIRRSEEYLWRG